MLIQSPTIHPALLIRLRQTRAPIIVSPLTIWNVCVQTREGFLGKKTPLLFFPFFLFSCFPRSRRFRSSRNLWASFTQHDTDDKLLSWSRLKRLVSTLRRTCGVKQHRTPQPWKNDFIERQLPSQRQLPSGHLVIVWAAGGAKVRTVNSEAKRSSIATRWVWVGVQVRLREREKKGERERGTGGRISGEPAWCGVLERFITCLLPTTELIYVDCSAGRTWWPC